jgi:hypothetical protein
MGMELQSSIHIERPCSDVFGFISDMRNHPKEEGSKVLLVEKITEGESGVGTQFREKVQMFPWINVSFTNEITWFEPDLQVEIRWQGGGMEGVLRLECEASENGSLLKLHETITPRGLMRVLGPLMRKNFYSLWENRLKGIQDFLEN